MMYLMPLIMLYFSGQCHPGLHSIGQFRIFYQSHNRQLQINWVRKPIKNEIIRSRYVRIHFEAEAKTKSEAEEITLKAHLRLSEGDLKFETVDPGKSGFLGFTSKKPAIVRAYVSSKDLPAENHS